MGDSRAQAWLWLALPPALPHLSRQPHVQTRWRLIPTQQQVNPPAAPGASPPLSGFLLRSAELQVILLTEDDDCVDDVHGSWLKFSGLSAVLAHHNKENHLSYLMIKGSQGTRCPWNLLGNLSGQQESII